MSNYVIYLSVCSVMGVSGAAWALTYVVERGNSLSQIAEKMIPGPIYGKRGSLARVLAKNPHIKNINLIFPGEKIELDGAALTAFQMESAGVARSPAAAHSETSVALPAPETSSPVQRKSGVPEAPLFQRGAYASLTPTYSLTGLSAKDQATGTPSTLASEYNAGIDIAYYEEWTSRTRSFISLVLGMVSFEPPTDSSKSIAENRKFLSGFGLGVNYDLSDRWNIEGLVDYEKELFARAISTQSVTLDAVSVPSLGAKLSFDVIRAAPFDLGVSSLVSVKGPAKTDSYNIRLGAQYGGIIYLKQNVGSGNERTSSFDTELGFFQRHQGTTFTDQTQTDILLRLRFYIPVGRRSPERNEEEGSR